jgi:hypothetical protein
MMISREKYSAQRWRVLEHSGDFTLWDAWELPVGADNSAAQNFRTFEKIFWQNMDSLSKGRSTSMKPFARKNAAEILARGDWI